MGFIPFVYGAFKGIKKIMAQLALHGIRKWDIASAHRVDHFIANSYYVAQRIEKIYRRPAHVIYPPVDIDSFYIADQKEEYFIACSRMVPYKKMDMIARAFQSMPDKKLILVGDGPQMSAIKKWASPNIEILGFVSDETLKTLLSKAKAMDLALTGRMMDANEAERAGLVARIFPQADLLNEVSAIAKGIADMPLLTAMMVKESINASYETSLSEGIHFERRLFHACFGTSDQKEGMAAFVEKRPAKFTNS